MKHHMLRHEDGRTTEFKVAGTAATVIKHVPGKPPELRHLSPQMARQDWKAATAEGFAPCPIDPKLMEATLRLECHFQELSSGRVCRCDIDPHCQEPKLTPAEMAEVLQEAGFTKQPAGENGNPQDVWERIKSRGKNGVTEKVVVWTGTLGGEFILGDNLVKDQVLVTNLSRCGRQYSRSKGTGIPFKALTKNGLLAAMRAEWKRS